MLSEKTKQDLKAAVTFEIRRRPERVIYTLEDGRNGICYLPEMSDGPTGIQLPMGHSSISGRRDWVADHYADYTATQKFVPERDFLEADLFLYDLIAAHIAEHKDAESMAHYRQQAS